MKTKFKLLFWAISVIMAVGSATLVSCEKSEKNIMEDVPLKSVKNPYTVVGELHNAIMYDLGSLIKDTLDAYALQGTLTDAQRDSLALYIISNIPSAAQNYSELQNTDSALDWFVESAYNGLQMGYADSALLASPAFSKIESVLAKINFEDSISAIQSHLQTEIDSMLLANEGTVAMFLTVLSHSIVFWDDARVNVSNPWHNFVNAFTFADFEANASKGIGRDTFNKIKGLFCRNHAEKIPKGALVAMYDAAGALSGAAGALSTGFVSVVIGAAAYSTIAAILL